MDEKGLAAVVLVALVVISSGLSAGAEDHKIDPALKELLSGKEEIPVIVLLNGDLDPTLDGLDLRYRYRLIHGLAGEATPDAIRRISEMNSVDGVYLDWTVRLEQDVDTATGEGISPFRIIGVDRLWEKGIDGSGVTVAVLDSGIDKNHPDLVGRVVGEKNFVADETTTDDLLGHGTMVAGIIAGSGAASGGRYRGVSPGADLLNVKVIDSSGEGRVSDIIAGIEWAIGSGADVLSLSLGGINLGETNPPITMAADKAADAGVVVCVAAGNRNSTRVEGTATGAQVSQQDGSTIDLSQLEGSRSKDVLLLLVPIVLALPPGLIDSPGDGVKVITLGASDSDGRIASFSGSGPTRDDRIKPDVVAPGVSVISTAPPGLERPAYVDLYYAEESGTSLSTPVAAGLAALLLQAEPELTPAGVKAAMARGALKLKNTQGEEYEVYYQGAGQLNASASYELLGGDLYGVIPDIWRAGRWAYLPAGEGVYAGLETGADRPQKKLYALAPGDEDWSTRFVFFSDEDLEDVEVSVSGEVSGWVSIQPLPERVEANEHKVFAASISVPYDASPGHHSGSLEISAGGRRILAVPIDVTVAGPLDISMGEGIMRGTLEGSGWDYCYLDVPPGGGMLEVSLDWQQPSSLDLLLLSPTSEYYTGEQDNLTGAQNLSRRCRIDGPVSGRWILAVHSENSSAPVSYSLRAARALMEASPRRWNLEQVLPGTSTSASFRLENRGLPLHNLSYDAVIERVSSRDLYGTVGYKEVWEETMNVTESTRRISARLFSHGAGNQSQILLVLESPAGEPEDAALGSGDLGPIEIYGPGAGPWKVKVYGYEVPPEGQSFGVQLKEYTEDPWTWVLAEGPKSLDGESNGTLEATITVPRNASLKRLDGIIKISSDIQELEIPVSVVLQGSSIEGLVSYEATDSTRDGYFDLLTLCIGVNVTSPGDYRIEGQLSDGDGNTIELFSRDDRLEWSGLVNISINGSDIWRRGRAGPLKIRNLILYDSAGGLVDSHEGDITLPMEPGQFQPPAAYITGITNLTTQRSIRVGVNITVTRPGSFQLSGTLLDDLGEEIGEKVVSADLSPGNFTLELEYNPARFVMLGRGSSVHLVDLVLSLGGDVLERREEAWSSGVLDPGGFRGGVSTGTRGNYEGGPAVIVRRNGTAIIS
ncbi:MAG: S8 family serine peptidase [Methanothrix sp.]|nr:S8 family serine peptidase [Methanothrix sp.]